MAVGFPTKANWAAGDVLTASALDDLAGTVNLLQNSAYPIVAGKNALINGGMDIWQRGTSFAANGTPLYTADRWGFYRSSSGVGCTVTRQTSGLTGVKYTARVQRDSGNTAVTVVNFYQTVETLNALQYAGKTLTISFYARSGANFSQAASQITAQVQYGTGTDENFINGFTGATDVANSAITISSVWTRYQITTSALSTSATEIGVNFSYTPVGTAGANDYFEITGIQLELGSTATTFSRAGGSIGGELALCQRYYEVSNSATPSGSGNSISITGLGQATLGTTTSTFAPTNVHFSVAKRTSPTVTILNGTTAGSVRNSSTGASISIGSYSLSGLSDGGFQIVVAGSAVFTCGFSYDCNWIASAEL